MTKRRTAYEQLLSILEEARNPIARTKLSRRTSLVYHKFRFMCQFLEEKRLLTRVECEADKRMNGENFMYLTTLKGLDILRAHKNGYESHAIYSFEKWKKSQK